VSQGKKENFKPRASLYDTETTQEEGKKKFEAPTPDTLEVKTEVTIRSFAKTMDKLREKIA
jgi:3-deoxy-D-arabino-heptulosonate 7-phosphate (DAHP) synthase